MIHFLSVAPQQTSKMRAVNEAHVSKSKTKNKLIRQEYCKTEKVQQSAAHKRFFLRAETLLDKL